MASLHRFFYFICYVLHKGNTLHFNLCLNKNFKLLLQLVLHKYVIILIIIKMTLPKTIRVSNIRLST